jgi:CheY-like chemotaxis protein
MNTASDIKDINNDLRGEGLILVIDDEDLMRRIAGNILQKCGYRVLTATGGEEGIEMYRKRHRDISVVLLDLAMPKLSGDQVYDRLKAIDINVKVILASGFGQDERVDAALRKGINAFIQKPYTIEKLAEAIRDLISSCGDVNL